MSASGVNKKVPDVSFSGKGFETQFKQNIRIKHNEDLAPINE